MRLIIFEPFLKDFSGHNYFYTVSVKDAAEKKGVPVVVFGNIAADTAKLNINNFYPALTDITGRVFESTSSFRKMLPAIWKNTGIFNKQLESCLLNSSKFKLEKNDLFFFPTVYAFELLALAFFLKKHSSVIIENNIRINILLRFRFIRESAFITMVLKMVHRYACNSLLKDLSSNIIYTTDSELLKQEFEKLLRREFTVYPIPISKSLLDLATGRKPEEPGKKPVISYLGASRYNKGFDVYVGLVERISADREFADKVSFLAQLYIQKQPEKDTEKMVEAAGKLRNLAGMAGNLEIHDGTVTTDEYNRLLMKSDITILAYRGEAFKSATSNILVESVIAGKIPVVSENTWLSHELERSGITGLSFNPDNIDSVYNTVKNVVNNYAEYRKKVLAISGKWAQYHNSANLVDSLLTKLPPF